LKQREPTDSPSGIELEACGIKTRYQWETNSDFPPEIHLLSAGWLRSARLPPSRLGIDSKLSCSRLVVGSEKRAKFAGETEKKRALIRFTAFPPRGSA
jgi:hypothetical protein